MNEYKLDLDCDGRKISLPIKQKINYGKKSRNRLTQKFAICENIPFLCIWNCTICGSMFFLSIYMFVPRGSPPSTA